MTGPGSWILLEGGGSRTWAALATGTSVRSEASGPSTNPRSVGDRQAVSTLAALLTTLFTGLPADRQSTVRGVIAAHGAASTTLTATRFGALLRDTLTATGLPGVPTLVTNDIAVPLLSADGPLCVVIAGTGTGFAARHGPRVARASGLEWLLSDEGGGHHIAVAALRAVIRAMDGRGPHTTLIDAASRWTGRDDLPLPDALFDAVYAAHSKAHVATFAEHVLEAASSGDHVATAVLDDAARELAAGAEAVSRRCGLTSQPITLIVAGSLLTRAHGLRSRLAAHLTGRLHLQAIIDHAATDRAAALLHLRGIWASEPGTLTAFTTALPTWASTSTARTVTMR
ncbi:N-acetylglucosamine kinase [Nonomuraea turkmeniaca]|uniref:N-acetylglucosamine kinase n=1 Tax=Nonomuraea turkmeniaca TaxID=103838 RepID=UPI001476BDAB|nr:BadF/BadG/BcrA/BcrD ATPase family protein [Nonomuraea turkmeniaca]